MNAESLTRALGGRWHGSYGNARCPAHKDKTPSLSISDGVDGRLLTCCQAGCAADPEEQQVGPLQVGEPADPGLRRRLDRARASGTAPAR